MFADSFGMAIGLDGIIPASIARYNPVVAKELYSSVKKYIDEIIICALVWLQTMAGLS